MTASQYAPAVKQAGIDLGISEKGIVIGFATVFVESNWVMYANASVPASMSIPHDAVGSDSASVGLWQQQVVNTGNGWWWGDAASCMDPYKSAQLFFQRLAANTDYNSGANTPGSYAQAVQSSAFPDRYDQRIADAQALYDSLAGPTPAPEVPVTDPSKPAYNEFSILNDNSEDRGGTVIDLELLHTQEGGGGDAAAEDLANFLKSTEGGANPVSYHRTISQASDGGVTVVNCVPTSLACWAVGSANNRSINTCFAGSSVSWSRDQWLAQSNAIDVAAYIAVQDCKENGISTLVVPPPYTAGTPGISDHKYVTDILGWGSHTDVGPSFPWDVFAAAVAKYANPLAPPGVPPVAPPVVPPAPTPVGPADEQLTLRWNQLGGQTLIEAVAEIRDKLLGTNDRPKEGAL